MLFQELSANVDKVSYNAALNMTMAIYPLCRQISAWDPANIIQYHDCTTQISNSSSVIRENMEHIERFSVNHNENTSLQMELEQILEDVDTAKGPKHAMAYIREHSINSNQSFSCLGIDGCLKATREVIIRLKMIDGGIFGLGTGSAGLYLAYHHNMLGPYFGDIDGNEWPHIPLYKEPTPLENNFNQVLMDIAFEMSNKTLRNISILDLPAFGSSIVTLRKELKKQFLWPIKTNFALLNSNPESSKKQISAAYKTLMDDWAYYMDQLDKKVYANHFTMQMKSNEHLNFTKYILADMKTFLTTIAGITQIHLFKLFDKKCTNVKSENGSHA